MLVPAIMYVDNVTWCPLRVQWKRAMIMSTIYQVSYYKCSLIANECDNHLCYHLLLWCPCVLVFDMEALQLLRKEKRLAPFWLEDIRARQELQLYINCRA